ncbi:ScpA family protein [Psychrobium sp. 1_MG-2023]|uniref:segregation and condensation protein A n=1 Tax=Psychrobium sp. 1_MG-2023 TaxID=3062624 RepID=UPI000C34B395|nr:ScpA family protein [Psychrobium sp. 1_MG-2023]MDP2560239.1 ScpA family protein [Psychrobium sp. 1_MG-2023]PKF57049.1 segregation/condensation protein A [Alteromonadales bacterium alter-6D02]
MSEQQTSNKIDNTALIEQLTKPPIAIVDGEPVADKPQDLFIPPEALTVFLNAFEGPLDLLLYLIRKHKFDILDLPISDITDQYMEYVDLMKGLNLDLAAEYLLMAAILAEIKSRMLLPVEKEVEEVEDDPRAALVERLKEYEQFKQAALDIDSLPRINRDYHAANADKADNLTEVVLAPQVTLQDLTAAFARVVKHIDVNAHHHIQRESLSTRERMSQIMLQLQSQEQLQFNQLFKFEEGRSGAIVSFLAILELCKSKLIGIALLDSEEQLAIFLLQAQDE